MAPAMFDKLVIIQAAVLAVFAVICLVLAVSGNGTLLAILTLLLSLVFSLKYRPLALATVITAGPLNELLTTGVLQIAVYVPFLLFSFIHFFTKKGKLSGILLYIWCILMVLLSYFFGYEPDTVMFLLQVFSMSMFYVVWQTFNKQDVPIVVWGYILSALVAIGYMSTGGLEAVTVTGRLSLGEHVKIVAFICAVPFVFILYPFIGRLYMFSNLAKYRYKIVDILLLIVLMLTIFMTLARGLMVAIAIGVLLLMMFLRKKKSIFFLLLIIMVAIYSFMYIESLDMFRTERMFAYEEYESGNGRTEIWLHYINKIFDMGGQYILFGTGPGNIERISNMGYYAHSTILDYFFSYGIMGIITFLIIEYLINLKLLKSANKIPFAISMTFLLAYATHGGAANLTLYLIQALMLICVKPVNQLKMKLRK